METPEPQITLRLSTSTEELATIEPLWNSLHEHHSRLSPTIGGRAPKRDLPDAWRHRREKYERWLEDPETFFILAEDGEDIPVGYAFVTVGPTLAGWDTGDRLAELETLSVLPGRRSGGIGTRLLEEVWNRLSERGVDDLMITTATTNVDSHRFYEHHGFASSFVIYYRQRDH